jgi:hypothetical protein
MAAVRAKNQAAATRVEAGSSANSAVVAQAQAAAAGITAELARYTLGVTQRRADLAYNQTVNRTASLTEDAKTAAYRRSVTSNTVGSTAQRVEIEGTAYGYKAASRFFDVATNAAGKAAEMTQSANEQLTRAYAVAQEAAGRALAALEAGKYSQLRTSVSLGASGSLSASSGGSRSTGTTLGWNVQEGWTQTESDAT